MKNTTRVSSSQTAPENLPSGVPPTLISSCPVGKNAEPVSAAAGRLLRVRRGRSGLLQLGGKGIHLGRRPFADLLPDLDGCGNFPGFRSGSVGLLHVVLEAGLAICRDRARPRHAPL